MSTLEIQKTLVLSTAHVTKEVNDYLQDTCGLPGAENLIMESFEYGWRIYTGSEASERVPTRHASLTSCIELARANDCRWLCLDQDGDTTDQLPTYSW